ncbi:MAG: N-acyl homoserine lactonase family protein [Acidimicrobiia bacterium]|nr:N-acyl homoserine lactonase family protein [Acidimicrobiia bacterium]
MRITVRVLLAQAAVLGLIVARGGAQAPLRLYVLDGGVLQSDPGRYQLTKEDVGITDLSVAAYLIVHPRGVLMWDTGAVPDAEWTPSGQPSEQRLVLIDKQERRVTLTQSLGQQLKGAGYSPASVTHLAFSHYHWDHTANAGMFAHATWLSRPAEQEAMFGASVGTARPQTYEALRKSTVVAVTANEHDVFGDGTVVLKLAAGHTPGHQVLVLHLPRTGPVVLSGDLYHYVQERTLDRYPTFEFNVEQTRAARKDLEAFLTRTKAALWIQHDLQAHRRLKKAPEYYE